MPWEPRFATGIKPIENRSRPTNHRGTLWIVAGVSRLEFRRPAEDLIPEAPPVEDLTFGAVIGSVEVVDCVPLEEVKGRRFAKGPWCWNCERPHVIKPVPCRGQLGLFNLPDEVARQIQAVPPC